ncbi:hypothetical protein ABB02_00325 [Clostridiaceae bacterium JG1575]|nr:hypothetical protein ABB02_00325 [Clostridiaceae bacterium JG1575]
MHLKNESLVCDVISDPAFGTPLERLSLEMRSFNR